MDGIVTAGVNTIAWQGYRAGETGIVVFYESDTNSELPLRKTSSKKNTLPNMDPNYETQTFGLYHCVGSKLRAHFVKKKYGYVFFMTRYQGTDEQYEGKLLLTGYYRIGSTADVRKLHLRYLEKNACFGERSCLALRADNAVFLSLEDAYFLNASALKSLGYDKKVTKMSKLELNAEQTAKVLKKFDGKENMLETYAEETKELFASLSTDDDA